MLRRVRYAKYYCNSRRTSARARSVRRRHAQKGKTRFHGGRFFSALTPPPTPQRDDDDAVFPIFRVSLTNNGRVFAVTDRTTGGWMSVLHFFVCFFVRAPGLRRFERCPPRTFLFVGRTGPSVRRLFPFFNAGPFRRVGIVDGRTW